MARTINPVVAGWMPCSGRFYPSALYRLLARINAYLVRWIRNKYRRYDATRAARAESRGDYPRVSPAVPALAMGHVRLLTRMTRAR